ncbi:50S ribosomal protein L28 [Gimesia chilikensis]|uniref:Large ribosomal subunit protein bL28 n=1 Tax=Gimesia chilikensis TaxID=2605989 RepID=A0A517PJ28_9PLAN|nr:50S ribosomal protein L28 [Gimesia chilikensis]MCR9233686.1 50S ribosomal protein L28 [bacterium]QDT19382.1 50S ribosomal protein L28 [Gimesia chilikensis]QDT83469.1 50S ribosomal protein L28 [Gimesia chilikensis]
MGQKCDACGKTPVIGNRVRQRGKYKYLGGNGRQTTGVSKRVFRPNLQKIRVQVGGSVQTQRVCTQCIRSGKVTKAVARKPFSLPST